MTDSKPSAYFSSSFPFIIHPIPQFLLLLCILSCSWLIGFNYIWKPKTIVSFIRHGIGVTAARTKRLFIELKRKSFHLLGLLIPLIFWTCMHTTPPLVSHFHLTLLMLCMTCFLWLVEILRLISPSFRAQYNKRFSAMLRHDETKQLTLEVPLLSHATDTITQAIFEDGCAQPCTGTGTGDNQHGDNNTNTSANASSSDATTPRTMQLRSRPITVASTSGSAASSPTKSAVVESLTLQQFTERKIFTGMVFYFTGCFLTIALFEPHVGTCSILYLVLGDMFAAMVGISFGTIKIRSKSLQGTLAMFITCCSIGGVFFHHYVHAVPIVALSAAVATLVELMGPPWLDDNLSIPLAAGVTLTYSIKWLEP